MLRRIQSAIRNWAKDKRNEAVLEQANNQALTTRPIQEQKSALTTCEGTFARSEVNYCLCNWSIKENCI